MTKIAIVTGATGNLGQSIVRKFIAEGYIVIGTAGPNDSAPMDFPGNRFEKQVVDLTDATVTQKFTEAIISKYGSIDVVVLTVGGFAMGTIAETSSADILKQYKLNFETTYHVARPVFVQLMKQNSGRIFIIGSRPGLDAMYGNGMVAYGLAKSLVVRLAELMNMEAKGKNVVTSMVVPSTIDTPQNRKAMPDAHFNDWVKPEDIAEVAYFAASRPAHVVLNDIVITPLAQANTSYLIKKEHK